MTDSQGSAAPTKADVKARLIRHDDSTVVVYIGDAPIEVRQARMPKTFEKLVAMIEKG